MANSTAGATRFVTATVLHPVTLYFARLEFECAGMRFKEDAIHLRESE